MIIEQWEDKNLSHFSYAVLDESTSKIVLIDPARNPEPYLDFAKQHEAKIIGIIETHPHADFVSGHLEISLATGADIYVSKLVQAEYTHKSFDEGDKIETGELTFHAFNTPGHSPDSLSIVLEENDEQKVVFTGDTLFIGDCGRPDLREGAGKITATRESLAKQMYHSLRDKLLPLANNIIVYPAHGAGSLCGKALSKAESSTMGAEKLTNWCLQPLSEESFVKELLQDQPVIPAYFGYDVDLNRKGAPAFLEGIENISIGKAITGPLDAARLDKSLVIVDARNEKNFKASYLPGSINVMEGLKFETWLGSIIKPGERFYLAATGDEQIAKLLPRIATIGYEPFVAEVFVLEAGSEEMSAFELENFRAHQEAYTIVDVRNPTEVKEKKTFASSLAIPLGELRDRINEIPLNKTVVVHCAAGYRSAAGSSIVNSMLGDRVKVLDFGEDIQQFS
ncbi:MAG: rhodanese-like domain-containing protein [Ferruginibacter sp.]